MKFSRVLGHWRRPLFQNVNRAASRFVVVSLVGIWERECTPEFSLLKREANQLSQDGLRLTTWQRTDALANWESVTKKYEQTQVVA
jgi:hypothetical protein